jgi:molecular chaperone DnaJ
VSKRDYYEILGVAKTATEQEIKSAYRKLALTYHPDRNPGDRAAEDKFKEAAEAYSVLADADKRHMYDRFGHAGLGGAATSGFDPSVFTGFEDILGGLGDIFGFSDVFGGGRRRGGPRRGADLRYDLEISFEESSRDFETSIQIPASGNLRDVRGNGAAEGSAPTTVRSATGADSCSISRASSRLRAPADSAAAPVHHRQAVPDVPGRRPRAEGTQADRPDSRGHRDRSAAAHLRRRRGRHGRWPAR